MSDALEELQCLVDGIAESGGGVMIREDDIFDTLDNAAGEIKRLRKELAAIKRADWKVAHIKDLEEQLTERRDRVDDLDKELAEAKAVIANLDERSAQYEAALEAANARIAELDKPDSECSCRPSRG